MTETTDTQTIVADLTEGTIIRVRRVDNYVSDVFVPDPEGAETRTVSFTYPSMIHRERGDLCIQYAPHGLSFAVAASTPVAVVNA